MDQGDYKHFSHLHSLIVHQMPEGTEVSCCGCNSSCIGTVFVCWQCNFFLHEQCYRATRSLKHPSHPQHPLSLFPYPTYPSNSFYCNSCEIIGTGFSYSCSDCEFDLHVRCAYSISRTTSFTKTRLFQELVPQSWIEGQNSNMVHNVPFVSVPDHSLPIRFNAAQNPYMPLSSLQDQYHPTGHDLACVSAPSSHQNSIPTVHDPTPYHNSIASAQYPSMVQTGHSVSNLPNPILHAQDSVTIPTCSQNAIPAPLYPSISVPTNPPNPIYSTQDPSMPQHKPSVSIENISQNSTSSTQYSNMGHYGLSAQPNPITRPQDPSMPQNGIKNKGIMHFSHPHILSVVDLQESEEKQITCSACEVTLVGKGYLCVEPKCDFHLHESCFNLKKEIRHKSHLEHPLTLLPLAPYNNKNGEFTCNACFSDGTGYTYHCSICTFDLHIQCVTLPETMNRNDHEHELKLFYSCSMKGKRDKFTCHVCHGEVPKEGWVYYCEQCDYGTHLGCIDCEECEGDNVTDAQAQLQMLQLQMQMASQQAQFMASQQALAMAGMGVKY